MSTKKLWIGVAGGAGLSVIGGIATHFICFFNWADPSQQIWCGVACKRLGVVAHVGGNVSIAVMTGVGGRPDVRGLTSSGADFAIDLGAKWGAMIKAGGKTLKAIKLLGKMSDAATMKKWISSESGKAFFNWMTGDLGIDLNKKGFTMFGTPAGLGLGAGIWYEWQKVQSLAGADAWNFSKPEWRLLKHKGKIWLQMKGIPQEDGAEVHIFNLRIDEIGPDSTLRFTEREGISKGYLATMFGETKNFRLVHKDYQKDADAPAGGGFNLSRYKLEGRVDVKGFWDRKVVTTPLPNQTFGIGLEVWSGKQRVWSTDDYVKVKTDASGQIAQIVNPGNKWKD